MGPVTASAGVAPQPDACTCHDELRSALPAISQFIFAYFLQQPQMVELVDVRCKSYHSSRKIMTESAPSSTDLARSRGDEEEKRNRPARHRHTKLAVDRIKHHRDQHRGTVGRHSKRLGTADGDEIGEFGHGKPFPPTLPAQEEYVVEFADERDVHHPHNWPIGQK